VARWVRASGRSLPHMLRTLPALFKAEGVPEGVAQAVEALGPGSDDVKKSYLRVIRVLHPDKVQASASLEQQVLSRCVFAALSEAYQAHVEAGAGPPPQPAEPPGPAGPHHARGSSGSGSTSGPTSAHHRRSSYSSLHTRR
jgi:hypothetical protein